MTVRKNEGKLAAIRVQAWNAVETATGILASTEDMDKSDAKRTAVEEMTAEVQKARAAAERADKATTEVEASDALVYAEVAARDTQYIFDDLIGIDNGEQVV
jgi:hypothetical protein